MSIPSGSLPYAGSAASPGLPQGIDAWLDDGVLSVKLDPSQADAENPAFDQAMQRLLQDVAADAAVRVVVLRGADQGFCAGLSAPDPGDTAECWYPRGLAQLPQPVVAIVTGSCSGAAFAVLDGCDIVLAADDTAFSLPQVDEGSFPDGRTACAISDLMTPRAARYYALTGDRFDSVRAERDGLISRSLPAADLERESCALARELAAKDATALQFTKETLRHVGSMSWDAVLSFTAAKFAELKALQAGRPSTRAAAVESFLAGKSKPGLGG
ncbi:enoyl-CoA hydratase-related protein [Piscinibacter sakaiensis]|uniref:enoyl-CoA hydratase-related protein n=1 Tax=Piscinibacter sakaiensis TaxID=1547922 RepID=UPI003AAB5C75